MRRIFAINEQPAENGKWKLEALAEGPGDSEPQRYGLHIDSDGTVIATPIIGEVHEPGAADECDGMGC